MTLAPRAVHTQQWEGAAVQDHTKERSTGSIATALAQSILLVQASSHPHTHGCRALHTRRSHHRRLGPASAYARSLICPSQHTRAFGAGIPPPIGTHLCSTALSSALTSA
eukprot:6191518-Pleurochrysis_carterae.AAC.2